MAFYAQERQRVPPRWQVEPPMTDADVLAWVTRRKQVNPIISDLALADRLKRIPANSKTAEENLEKIIQFLENRNLENQMQVEEEHDPNAHNVPNGGKKRRRKTRKTRKSKRKTRRH